MVGTGAKISDSTSNEDKIDYFKVDQEEKKTHFQGQLIESTATIVQLTGPKGMPLAQHLPAFRRQLEKIVKDVADTAKAHEHLQIIVGSNQSNQMVSTKFFKAGNTNGIPLIMAHINSSTNSSAMWSLDDEIRVTVKHVKNPPAINIAGRTYKSYNAKMTSHERRCIVEIPNDTDMMCLARSIAVLTHAKKLQKAKDEKQPFTVQKQLKINYDRIRKDYSQKDEALELCNLAGIDPRQPCGIQDIRNIELVANIYIKIVAADQFNKIVYDGVKTHLRPNIPINKETVYFLFRNTSSDAAVQHVDPIVSHNAFFNSKNFCFHCNKGYKQLNGHICHDIRFWCYSCWQRDCTPDPSYTSTRCKICQTLHRSNSCQLEHEQKGICKSSYFCPDCRKVIARQTFTLKPRLATDNPTKTVFETDIQIKARHKCGKICQICNETVDAIFHKCFLKKTAFKEPSDLLLFFDYETDQSSGVHIPIYWHATWYDPSSDSWLEKHFWIKDHPVINDEVGKFLFAPQFRNYTLIAHNMKGFDGCFLLQYLGKNGIKTTPVFAGKKIISLELTSLKIRIIDSMNFLPMPLAGFEKAFGLHSGGKGHFPHFFAKPENYTYKGDLPPKEAYGCDTMKPEARAAFISWYEEEARSGKPVKFDFENDIATYCRQDVILLKEGCLAFKSLLMELTDGKCDPFRVMTLAGVASAIYKANFLKEKTIAAVPPNGYADIQNFSSISLEWLEWERQQNYPEMIHIANSPVGEASISGFRVDGIDRASNTIFEFYGCYYHGCPKCFPNRNQLNKNIGKTFEKILSDTLDRETSLVMADWNVITMWECEWKKQKERNPDLQDFIELNKFKLTPMSPFDSFFGGRVETFKMVVDDGRLLIYEDVTSLYPFINATKEYPVGHPEVILENFGDPNTACDRYFGFMKCTILPPEKLYIPVLPGKYGSDQKLLFTLCRTCAETRTPEITCNHTENERALTGTWFIAEIKKAQEVGYKIQEIHGIYHFQETSTELFADYIRLFYKLKLTSSGRPPNCDNDEKLQEYIDQVHQRENILLQKDDFQNNPGMRQVSKLLINSLWGKFGLRRNLPSHQFCSSINEIAELLHDETLEVTNILSLHEDLALVTTKKTSPEHFELNNSANIYIASTTTAWARLELYNYLEKLGERVVYCDTDSIIYEADLINPENNLKRGPFLGELTNELKNLNDFISIFFSGGPKNYTYRTLQGEECLKVKGFSMNYINKQAFTLENMKQVILNFLDIDPNFDCEDTENLGGISKVVPPKARPQHNISIRDSFLQNHHNINSQKPSAFASNQGISVYNPASIKRSQTWDLLSKPEQKLYTVNYDKRIVTGTFNTFPFGFKFN